MGAVQVRRAPVVAQRFNLSATSVLVIDDAQTSRDIINSILQGFGVTHRRCCSTATEAWELLEREAFDLVIADGEMPDQDGFDLTSKVRADPDGPNFTVPILLVSAHTPRAKIGRARDAGANMVVRKPLAPGVLLDRIEWLARTPRKFVSSPGYRGPDRRFQTKAPPDGIEERRADAQKRLSQPELSQNDIDSLFD